MLEEGPGAELYGVALADGFELEHFQSICSIRVRHNHLGGAHYIEDQAVCRVEQRGNGLLEALTRVVWCIADLNGVEPDVARHIHVRHVGKGQSTL